MLSHKFACVLDAGLALFTKYNEKRDKEKAKHCKTVQGTYVHISRNYTSVTYMCTDVHIMATKLGNTSWS
eukprot:3883385-Rhodomonas_salina.1